MPNSPSILVVSDAKVKRWYEDAVKAGYGASLVRRDGYLLNMAGWSGDTMKDELHGYRWHEWVDPEHIAGLLAWIADPEAPDGFTYRAMFNTPSGPRMKWVSLSKVCGPSLRLMIGVAEPVALDELPRSPCDAGSPETQ